MPGRRTRPGIARFIDLVGVFGFAQRLSYPFFGHGFLGRLAQGHVFGEVPHNGRKLAVQLPYAAFAGVVGDYLFDDFIGKRQFHICQPVRFLLFGDQVALGDLHFSSME